MAIKKQSPPQAQPPIDAPPSEVVVKEKKPSAKKAKPTAAAADTIIDVVDDVDAVDAVDAVDNTTAPSDNEDGTDKKQRHRRMPRAIREKMVVELDRAINLLVPVAKNLRKATIEREHTPQLTTKEIGKQVTEILKKLRSGLRVRSRRVSNDRPTSVFNLFVRETMSDMKANGIVFENTTQRMKECGRLWKIRKAEIAGKGTTA